VYLLLAEADTEVQQTYATAEGDVRAAVRLAAELLSADGEPLRGAGREMVRLQQADTVREAEAIIRSASVRLARRLAV